MRDFVLRQVELELLRQRRQPLQKQLKALLEFLSHELREHVEVLLLLCTLGLRKVLVLVIRVFVLLLTDHGRCSRL